MPTMPMITALLEQGLNRTLWQDRGAKSTRQRLKGKVLTFVIRELSQPIVLHFSEQQIDVLSTITSDSDCTVSLSVQVLPKLQDRKNLTTLIKSGQVEVEGDLQVIQLFSTLIDLAEFDPAEYLAPWVGDLLAHSVAQTGKNITNFLQRTFIRRQSQVSDTLIEEWRVVPGALEQAWFCEEVQAVERQHTALEERLSKLESL
ncbi:SCP2 domain-containing protein [Tatumella sp. TA1]|uniref:ubiquinone biosynthesis protein UbiJ n=1 Tax=Rosenbergiella collisarenosi TaxID=1544695 RepID=UPI0008F8AB2D|nr:SCP2 domain-containing protein [Rosenbergiella collisarenosi]MBT0721866.1 SCP2 domain-containing protein [Rosenbergiella collisarenosi]QGX92693.1 SCP2 domain-containing protein [Tatumella sp. TA1]